MIKEFALPAGRKRTKALFAVAVIAVLIATLKPFSFMPRNGVTWLGTRGLKFKNAGLVTSNEPLRLVGRQDAESYSLELLLCPARTKSQSTILAFYAPSAGRELLLQQWRDGLVVTHDYAVWSDRTPTMTFFVAHVFRPGKFVLMTISSKPDGTNVYLDGQLAQSFPHFRITGKDLSRRIVLGTSAVVYEPWSGDLRGLSVYSKPLMPADVLRHYHELNNPSAPPDLEGAIARYSFAEGSGSTIHNDVLYEPNLEIPVKFTVPEKEFLSSPAQELKANRRYATDVLINIIGFTPLGLIGCAYFSWVRSRWKAILLTTVACGILSFVIEVLQYYIPPRGSGVTDIITNTLGAALGAMLLYQSTVRSTLEKVGLICRATQYVRSCQEVGTDI